jgi:RNA polymerase sigma-70 factor (ECF subfamily)
MLATSRSSAFHAYMSVRDNNASFDTTRWSVIAMAGNQLSSGAMEALESLCKAYWYPLYAYARRRGLSGADAEDVTQEFFCRLVRTNYLASLDRRRGSFRSFLLASMNHLLVNEWEKARTLKRGGGHQIISLDGVEAEERYAREPVAHESPEKSFDRRWALTLLDRALGRLQDEFSVAGKLPQFEALKGFLSDVADDGEYPALGEKLGMDAGAVAVAVHRLRLRYREIVRTEVAQTVTSDAELKAEMSHLFASLA